MPDIVVPARRRELEPRLPVPVLAVDVAVDELEPVVLARALYPQAEVLLPKLELGNVESRLRVQLRGVRALRRDLRVDLLLRLLDLLLQRVSCGQVLVALLRQLGDGGLHLARLGLFLLDGLLVCARLVLENLNVLLLHALVLCDTVSQHRLGIDTAGMLARPDVP